MGNFSWCSKRCMGKTRITGVIYSESNNELVRTKTLLKDYMVLLDSTPHRQWYQSHYVLPLGHKKRANLTPGGRDFKQKNDQRIFRRTMMMEKRMPKSAVF
ncbi:hypothetical protein CB1_000826001 [Camelus ferus]|nr:hypothetical protein CB1_000826001 [Camelus ferus]